MLLEHHFLFAVCVKNITRKQWCYKDFHSANTYFFQIREKEEEKRSCYGIIVSENEQSKGSQVANFLRVSAFQLQASLE